MQEHPTIQEITLAMIRALNDAYWLHCYASTRELRQFARDALDYWHEKLQKRDVKYHLAHNGTWVILSYSL